MSKRFICTISPMLLFLLFNASLSAQHLKIEPGLPAYFLKKNEQLIHALVSHASFRPGDLIADIGAGDGLIDAGVSIFTDSITFYMEDIDSTAFDPNIFNRAIQFYSSVKKRKITNTFRSVLGKEKTTELQSGFFDKVLIIDTYHHFSFRDEMIEDINRILKPGGELFIYDVLAKRKGDIHPVCQTPIFLKDEFLIHIQSWGFVLKEIAKLKKSSGRKARLFIFTKVTEH